VPRPNNHGIINSFRCAGNGVVRTFLSQRNIRLQAAIGVAVIVAGFVFQLGTTDWALVVLCISGVLVSELLNTAVEAAVDLISPDYHELARVAKDAAAGAALVAAASSVIVGLLIFVPRLLRLAQRL